MNKSFIFSCCFKSVASFCHPQYLLRTSPRSIPEKCLKSRFCDFEAWIDEIDLSISSIFSEDVWTRARNVVEQNRLNRQSTAPFQATYACLLTCYLRKPWEVVSSAVRVRPLRSVISSSRAGGHFPHGFRMFSAWNLTPVAGPIFETKNRAIFLERFFGRGITAREQVSRAVILARFISHPVMSWYGSRAVGCPLGREITAKTCSLLGNEGTPPDFESFFLEKRPRKRVSTNVLIRGKWIHSTPINKNKVVGAVMLLPNSSPEKSQKSLDFVSQKIFFFNLRVFESRVFIENWWWVSQGHGGE